MKWHFVIMSFFVGLLSLGEEIVWVRIISFMGHSVPQSFSYVLFCYISGIAAGALLGPKILRFALPPLLIISGLLISSALVVLVTPWLIQIFNNNPFLTVVSSILIFACAGFKGAIFPLVHHWFSLSGKNLGKTLSWVYFANLMGSALGPLLVGFWLLDNYSMFTSLVILGVIELLLVFFVLIFLMRFLAITYLIFVLILCVFLLNASKSLLAAILAENFSEDQRITNLIENRHGVIFTLHNGNSNSDIVYGGNVYDGSFNVDLVKNSNKIDRAYLLAALQPKPRNVLFIGLSSGSWLRVVAAMQGVESIDVVEINKGYSDLVSLYPGADDIFNDRRIHFSYMDGRQLVQKAITEQKKYDLIVMNNTWHWRIYSTNLLSVEFMKMLKQIMSPGAVSAFNSTDSLDAVYTATKVFDKTYVYRNFVYVSDRDLNNSLNEHKSRFCELETIRIEQQGCEQLSFFEALNKIKLLEWDQISKASLHGRNPELITDDNMIIEYRYGMGFSM